MISMSLFTDYKNGAGLGSFQFSYIFAIIAWIAHWGALIHKFL